MSLSLVFRVFSAILFLNFLGVAFAPELWLEQANFSTTPDMITLGQAFGVSLLGFAFIGFRIPEIAGKSLPAFGQVFSIVSLFFVVLISYLGCLLILNLILEIMQYTVSLVELI